LELIDLVSQIQIDLEIQRQIVPAKSELLIDLASQMQIDLETRSQRRIDPVT
jgi:hypothetical protein